MVEKKPKFFNKTDQCLFKMAFNKQLKQAASKTLWLVPTPRMLWLETSKSTLASSIHQIWTTKISNRPSSTTKDPVSE